MYFTKKLGFVFVMGLVLMLVSSHALGEEAKFRYKFNEGDVIVYKLINGQANEQMGMKMETEQTQYMQYKVLSVDDDVATFEVTITRILFKGNVPMQGETSFDSASEEESSDPNSEMFKMMINKPFTMAMNTRGKIVSVTGYSLLAKSMIEKIAGEADGNPQAMMQVKMMESMFSDESMTKIMSQSNTYFPESSVKAGESWEESSVLTIPMIGDLVSSVNNTFESMENDVAKVKVMGKLEMKPVEDDAAADPQDPMAAMRKMMKITKGAMEGSLEFDNDRGLVKKKIQNMTITISMMGQEMPMKQSQIMELDSFKPAE